MRITVGRIFETSVTRIAALIAVWKCIVSFNTKFINTSADGNGYVQKSKLSIRNRRTGSQKNIKLR